MRDSVLLLGLALGALACSSDSNTGSTATGGSGGHVSGGAGGTSGSGGGSSGAGGGAAGSGGAGGSGGIAGSGGGGGGAAGSGGAAGAGGNGGAYRLSSIDAVLDGGTATSDGGLLLVLSGTFGSGSHVLRLGESGALTWSTLLKNQLAFNFGLGSATQRADGGFALAGWNDPSSGPGVIVALSASGQLEWAKSYSALGTIEEIWVSSDGGYLVQGRYSQKPVLARLDAQGNVVWAKSYTPGTGMLVYHSSRLDGDGIAVLGQSSPGDNLMVIAVDGLGNSKFTQSFSLPPAVPMNGRIVGLPNGGALAAYAATTTTSFTTVVAAFDATGSVTSAHGYDGLGMPGSIAPLPNGEFLIAGEEGLFQSGKIWLAHAQANGTLSNARIVPESGTGFFNQPVAIASSNDGSVRVASFRTDNSDWWATVDGTDASEAFCEPSQVKPSTGASLTASANTDGAFSNATVTAAALSLSTSASTLTLPKICGN